MSAYLGTDLVYGLPLEMIESVVENCKYLVWNYAGDIFRIVESVCD